MGPKVSVCIVTYNHERYIAECLESVLSQETEFPLEVIVGEDCSTDGTSDVVNAIARKDARVTIMRPERNIGVTQNLMAIHNAAKGEYVVYLDGDDLMGSGKLAKQAVILDQNPGFSACGHQMRVVDAEGNDIGALFPAISPGHFDLQRLIRLGLPVFPSSLMYRRSARTLKAVDFDIYDWFLFSDILKSGPCGYIHEPLGAYRVHRESQAAREGRKTMIRRMIGLYRRRLAELPQYRADFMARGLMWAWHTLLDDHRIDRNVWRFVSDSFSPTVIGPFIDAYRWARNNKTATAGR